LGKGYYVQYGDLLELLYKVENHQDGVDQIGNPTQGDTLI
jgi:hypothetical protein